MTALIAYTPDQVARVTGLSRRQLTYWDKTGFFRPRFAEDQRRFGRMYSFKDVVGLRTIASLRGQVPLQELRKVGAWLHERYFEPWSGLRFWVIGRRVVFEDPTGVRMVAGSSQVVLPVHIEEIERDADLASRKLLERAEEQIGHITRNRYVQHNAWVLDGTRIPTAAIGRLYEDGYTVDAIVRQYPRLTRDDVEAAVRFEGSRASRSA